MTETIRDFVIPKNEAYETFSTIQKLSQLRQDVELSTKTRDFLMDKLSLSPEKNNNSVYGNFSLGVIDGLIEFPAIIELFANNAEFREKLWITIKQITFKDFINSLVELGKWITHGDAYEKWKTSLRIFFFATGLAWLLRAFGLVITRNVAGISIKSATMSTLATWTHTLWYATEQTAKRWIAN